MGALTLVCVDARASAHSRRVIRIRSFKLKLPQLHDEALDGCSE